MPKQVRTTKQDAVLSPLNSGSSDQSVELISLVERLTRLSKPQKVVISCNPSLEGVVGAVGLTYLSHANPAHVRLVRENFCQPSLGEHILCGPDPSDDSVVALARRVLTGLEKKVGSKEITRRIVLACASDAYSMPEVVHRYIRLAFLYGVGALEDIADPTVAEFNALARQVESEREHTRQFVRFSRMSDGSFMSVFQPNANVVPLTCNYFVKRMSTERFFIVDPAHHIVSFYAPEMKTFGTIQLDDASLEELLSRTDLATDEKYVQAMWRRFYEGVGLEGRGPSERGYDLRGHWMPKRVWQGLPELTANTSAEAARSQGIPARYQGRENKKDVHHIEQKQTFCKELTSGL